MNIIEAVARLLNSNQLSIEAVSLGRGLLNRLCGGYVLALHDISGKRFKEQVRALRPDQPVSLSELVARKEKGLPTAGLFAITLDDGFADRVLNISQISVELGYPVTFYLPTGFVDGKPMPALLLHNIAVKLPHIAIPLQGKVYDLAIPDVRRRLFHMLEARMKSEREDAYFVLFEELIGFVLDNKIMTEEDIYDIQKPISWTEVSELSKQENLSFESHGVTHQAVVALSHKELTSELTKSKETISYYSGREVTHFAYPYGATASIGQKAPNTVARYYRSAVTMNRGRVSKSNLNFLPRIPLYEKDGEALTILKLLTM